MKAFWLSFVPLFVAVNIFLAAYAVMMVRKGIELFLSGRVPG